VCAHQPFPARTASREQAEPAWPPAIDSSRSQRGNETMKKILAARVLWHVPVIALFVQGQLEVAGAGAAGHLILPAAPPEHDPDRRALCGTEENEGNKSRSSWFSHHEQIQSLSSEI
jgi:hypothetical protein